MSATVKSVVETAQNVVGKAYNIAEPYVPTVVKDTAAYGVKTATPLVNSTVDYATKTVNGTVDYTAKTVNGTVEFAAKTVNGTVQYAKDTVHGTIDYTSKTVNGTVEFAKAKVSDATIFASNQANSALEFSKVVVNGATTTIHAHTPGPILTLIDNTVAGAQALRADPVGAMKPYVPAFVIHFGEKTYEIVGAAQEKTIEGVKSASGFIVTKVNGTVHFVTEIPIVHQLIETLNSVTAPVIAKFGKKQIDGSVHADGKDVVAAKEQ
ncbi:hypothetical protein HDV03_001087 [Kappamyces sp. JEL0829]|nr:hypothetical protein HDV03_001087 [Kappamyces sp. JEL0829]